MRELIDHILHVASQNNKKITHLQLHKVGYFTFGYLIREKHYLKTQSLYKQESFQAWLYGPVLPTFYEKYKKYSNTSIVSKGKESKYFKKSPNLNKIILNLINHDVFDLVRISHEHEFWIKNKPKIFNNKKPDYDYESLKREFSK